MRKLLLGIIALMAVPAMAQGQDVTGNWQGTLQVDTPLRLVIRITSADGALKAVMYSIDQGGQGIPASAVNVQGGAIKISVAAIGATFEGKLDAAGSSMTGTFTQGPMTRALTLNRATGDAAWAIPEPPARIVPMAADAVPGVEVATIKPSKPETQGKLFTVRGRTFATVNTSLSDLITFAFGLHARQITGGPAWLETDKYDLSAQPSGEGQPNANQWKAMMRQLLADRFKLAFHHDKKELGVYAIVVGKSGVLLTKSEGDPNALPSLIFTSLGVLPARNASMAEFAGVMQSAVLDRPVVDQTGLPGKYDFTLRWTPDESQFGGMAARVPAPSANAAAPPGLFTAIQEQLGLRLESTRAPVDVIVIDHVEKPTEN